MIEFSQIEISKEIPGDLSRDDYCGKEIVLVASDADRRGSLYPFRWRRPDRIPGNRGMAMFALMTALDIGLHRRDNALLVILRRHANSLNFFASFLYCGGAITIFSRAHFDPELCLKMVGRPTFL